MALPATSAGRVWDGHGGSGGAAGGFFADADFDSGARIVLGAAAPGIGDVGLVLATLDRVTDGDPQSWSDAWTEMAADLTARGDEALRLGHPETAVAASQGRIVRMQVPYEDTLLPGYLLRPDDTGAARPTLVMINGSDGSLPGQQSLLILDPDDEQFFPGQSRQLYELPARQAADVSPARRP